MRLDAAGAPSLFPGGFGDETYIEWERAYKWVAHERWMEQLAPPGAIWITADTLRLAEFYASSRYNAGNTKGAALTAPTSWSLV